MNVPLQMSQLEKIFDEGYALPDLLPYLEYTNGLFVLSDGSLGKVWQINPLEIEGKCEESLVALAGQWESLLTRLPHERLAVQVILTSDGEINSRMQEYLAYTEADGGRMEFAKGKESHAHACHKGFFSHRNARFVPKRLRLFVTLRCFPDWTSSSLWMKAANFINPKCAGRAFIDAQMIVHQNEFSKQTKLIEGAFNAAGVNFKDIEGNGLTQWLYELLNPKRSQMIPQTAFHEEEPLRDQVLFHAPQVNGNGFRLEETHMRVISLKELPPSTTVGMFTREFYEGTKFCLLDNPRDFMLVVNFTVPGSNEAVGRLNMHKTFAFMHQDNWLGDKSVEAVEKKKELDETIATMFTGGGRIVNARIHWIIRDDQEDEAEAAANQVLGGLNRLNCQGLKEEIIGGSLFLTCLPLNFDPYYERFIRRARCLVSANAVDMLPVFGSFGGTKTPAQMYSNRRGEIIFIDFFDSNINPHGVVIGASGAGKSFFINDFILQNDRLGAHFFVLDKGDSYKKLCGILNGRYMSFDLNHPVTINPFVNDPTPENLSFLLFLLSQMASGGDERDRLSREEEGLIHRAVVLAYERRSPAREITLSDVTAILNDNAFNEQYGVNSLMGPTLGLRLTPFTKKGPYGGFFDGPNQFSIEQSFTVFELANLSAYPDLQTAVLLNLMFYMTNFVSLSQMRSKRKYLLIDEAWSLLKVKNTADFITNAFKTFRKYRCSVIAITQELADLTRQESGIAIVANASNKVFLKQEASIIDLLKDKLSMEDGTIKALKTLETVKGKFSEAFVITDTSSGVIRLVPDPFLYWAANSEPRNNEYLLKQAQQCGGNLIEAIKLCAKEHPYGIK